jgi:hypothetical protein
MNLEPGEWSDLVECGSASLASSIGGENSQIRTNQPVDGPSVHCPYPVGDEELFAFAPGQIINNTGLAFDWRVCETLTT